MISPLPPPSPEYASDQEQPSAADARHQLERILVSPALRTRQTVLRLTKRNYTIVPELAPDRNADDLLQEIFVKVWRALPNFRQDAQLFTWLYRIATNECLSHLSSRKRKVLLPMTETGELRAAQFPADEVPAGEAIEQKLQAAILTLPDKQRLVFNLRYYDEMPYEQMADVTGTSVGALKASYHHAARKIEEFMTRRD